MNNTITLNAANASNVETIPATTTIPAGGYTQGVGFGSNTFNVRIEFLTDPVSGTVDIQTSGTDDFAAPTTPVYRTAPPFFGGAADATGFTAGQILLGHGLVGSDRWRVKNNTAGTIKVSYVRSTHETR